MQYLLLFIVTRAQSKVYKREKTVYVVYVWVIEG